MLKNKNSYHLISMILFFIVNIFSYYIAEIDDAPGVIIFGLIMSFSISTIIYGIGDIVNLSKAYKKSN